MSSSWLKLFYTHKNEAILEEIFGTEIPPKFYNTEKRGFERQLEDAEYLCSLRKGSPNSSYGTSV